MRGATLASLVTRTKEALGASLSSALGQNFLNTIKGHIRLEYERLYDEFDWPHLTGHWGDKPAAAGQRYYDLPETLSLETLNEVYVRWGSVWRPLSRGFGPAQYNAGDSDSNYRSDPIQCWRPCDDDQIEVWPLPASASTLRFVGKKKFTPLVDDNDHADLDDRLISLFAAGVLLQRRDSKEAAVVLAMAAQRLNTLRARSQTGEERVNLVPSDDSYDPTKREERYLYAPLTGTAGTATNPAQIVVFASGAPTAGETLLVYNAGEALTLAAADSTATAEVAATATAVFSITRNAVEIGTITFLAGATTGTVSLSSTGLSVDDALRIIAPSPADATLSGISITLVGA